MNGAIPPHTLYVPSCREKRDKFTLFYLYILYILKSEMGGTGSAYGGEERHIQCFGGET